MIGIWSQYSTTFMVINIIAIAVAFSLPMMLYPMKWAKVLGWHIPEHDHLAVYFGRCLGAMALGVGLIGFQALSDPKVLLFYFNIILVIFISMMVIHIYGAFKRIQPISETIEIGFWLAQVVICLCFYPAREIAVLIS